MGGEIIKKELLKMITGSVWGYCTARYKSIVFLTLIHKNRIVGL